MPEPLLTAVNCPLNLLRSFKDDVHLKHKLTFETCAYLAYTEGATDCGVPFEFLPVLRLLLPFAGHSHYSGIYSSHFLRPLLFIGFSGTKCCLFLCLRRWSQLEHDYTVQCTAAINNNWITMSVYCTVYSWCWAKACYQTRAAASGDQAAASTAPLPAASAAQGRSIRGGGEGGQGQQGSIAFGEWKNKCVLLMMNNEYGKCTSMPMMYIMYLRICQMKPYWIK